MDPSVNEIHQQFSEYGQHAKEWLRKCQLLLPLVAKYRVWEKKGFGSIYEYAAKLAGMSKTSVDNALWVIRKVEDKPELKKLIEELGINKVKTVASISTPETQGFWVEKVKQMAQHTLETYVRETKKVLRAEKTQPGNIDINISLNSALARRLGHLKKHIKFQECFEKKFEELLNHLEKEFTQDKPEPLKNAQRYIPVAIRKNVLERTSGLCAFPGCAKTYAILHHTQRFALEKTHDPERLVALCTAHERLAHHGLIQNETGPHHAWSIRKEPDRTSPRFWIDQMVALYR